MSVFAFGLVLASANALAQTGVNDGTDVCHEGDGGAYQNVWIYGARNDGF